MTCKNLILWGASGHAKVLNEFSSKLGYKIQALFDNFPPEHSPLSGVKVFEGSTGFQAWKELEFQEETCGAVAIGGARGEDRYKIQNFLEDEGIKIVKLIHPTAYISTDASLGKGVQILAKSVVGADVHIGDACIVNTRASVDHECTLGRGVHVAPGATLCGCITVDDFAFIGAGATILPRLKIGKHSIIGAGAVVTKDVPDHTTVVGCPARIVSHAGSH